MEFKMYQVDAFTDHLFSGNPAAVVQLKDWVLPATMQKIAAENNLAETAFIINTGYNEYGIRWFTPTVEVDLCGHATLAAAFVLFHEKKQDGKSITFKTQKSGKLVVERDGGMFKMNFPTDEYEKIAVCEIITNCFNIKPSEAYKGKMDYMFVFASRPEINALIPDLQEIAKLKCRGVIVTAPGDEVDFVSRFFAPQSGIVEDSVTGSAHVTLTPYWSKRLDKKTLTAKQLSQRGGFLKCTYLDDRVEISGTARLYMKGVIFVDEF